VTFHISDFSTFFGLPRLRLGLSLGFDSEVLTLRGLPRGLFSFGSIFSSVFILRGLPRFLFSPLVMEFNELSPGIILILPSETNFNKTFSISLLISRFN